MTLSRLVFTAIVVLAAARNEKLEQSPDKAMLGELPKVRGMKKVASMLESLRKKVLEEGEAEDITHVSVERECKTLRSNKNDDIRDGEDKKNNLGANIQTLAEQIQKAGETIGQKEGDVKTSGETQVHLKTTHEKARTLYFANKADMDTAVVGLEQASRAMKAGNKKSSLVQIQSVQADISQALLLADALGFASAPKAVAFMQQAPTQGMKDYSSHSKGILGTLEDMTVEFKKQRDQLDNDEQKRVQSYQVAMQFEIVQMTAAQVVIDDQTSDNKRFAEDKVNAEIMLASTEKEWQDNKKMLDSTNTLCKQKDETHSQRKQMREEEDKALQQATKTINDIQMDTISGKKKKSALLSMQASNAVASSESDMEDIEQEAEDSEVPATFLQTKATKEAKAPMKGGTSGFMQKAAVKAHSPDDTRDVVVELLRSKGHELHSMTLMTIASEMSADPLAKVKSLVEGLVDNLQKEAAEESSAKGHCDKQIAENTRKKDHSSKEATKLNAQLAKLESLTATLSDEIDSLKTQEAQLSEAKKKEEAQRKEEKDEEVMIQGEAVEGETAVRQAMASLSQFYGESKNKAEASGASGASAGHSAEGAGVIAMMDVIASDFKRTLANSQAAASMEDAQLEEFQTTSDISIVNHKATRKAKNELQRETDAKILEKKRTLKKETGIVDGATKELKILKASCNKGQTYAERKELRVQEIASLNKAHCAIAAETDGNADTVAAEC